jgi:hypothetical protein
MKTHGEMELQLHHCLPQHKIQESGQLYAPDSLPSVPTVQKVGWAPEPVWTLWRKEKSLAQQRIEPQFLCRPARTLVAIPTELFRLSVVTYRHLLEGTEKNYDKPKSGYLVSWPRCEPRTS